MKRPKKTKTKTIAMSFLCILEEWNGTSLRELHNGISKKIWMQYDTRENAGRGIPSAFDDWIGRVANK